MPDTGAPWNIPYAQASDLVRDWPALSEDVADAVAAGLTAVATVGIGTNVVASTLATSFTTTSGTYVSTGLSVTITPASTSNKVLLIATLSMGFNSGTAGRTEAAALFRGSTEIGSGTDGFHYLETSGSNITNKLYGASVAFLDSPSSTSELTYQVRIKAEGGDTVTLNRPGTGTTTRLASSQLIAIEVAG